MAIKFPKLSKKEDDYNDFYSGSLYDDDITSADDDMKINEPETEDDRNGAFGGINESAVSLKIITPSSFGEAKKVADALMEGSSVVLNVENIEGGAMVRFMDFLMGVIYVINGNMKRVSKTTVIVTPNNVGVEGEESSDEE